VLYTKEEIFERITLCLSGRVAEEHYLGKSSTLSERDLQLATRLAEKMMKNLGMSKLGNITAKNLGEKNLTVLNYNLSI
jgi:cell division protease FtsH